MTIIKHYKNPHIVKLDGRFKGYNRGFRYRIDFNTYGADKWQAWLRAVKWCEAVWGKEYSWSDDVVPHRLWNDNYRTEFGAKNKYYRHLYLCREEDVTMLLLVGAE